MAKNFGKVNVSITASTGGLTAGLSSASKQLAGFKRSASGGLGGISGMFTSAAAGALGLGRGASIASVGVAALSTAIKSMLAPLAIVAAVAAPFVALAQATAAAERVHNLSQELGVAADQLQVLQAVGGEFGLSTEQMTGAMRRASRMTSELATGTPAAQKAFAQLGLTMQDMAGLDAAQQFSLIAGRIAALPPQMQAAAAIDIFGRSGQALLPFLRQGGDGIREMDRLMTDLGEQMTGAMRQASRMTSELAKGTPAAQKAFAQLGLTMQDMAGLDAAQQFSLIADRIAALPPQMQAAAAIDIFGRSGQALLPFLRQGNNAIREMDRLMTDLGVKMSGPQVAAIEAMGDSLGRLMMPVQGFINQFLAGVAPAIKTVADMLLEFFADNTKGWSLASSLATAFTGSLKMIVGAFTILYGVGQVFWGVLKAIGGSAGTVFGMMLKGIGNVISGFAAIAGIVEMVGKVLVRSMTLPLQGLIQLLAEAASAVGMTGMAKDLQKAADSVAKFGQGDWGLESSAKKQAESFKQLGQQSMDWGAAMGESAGASMAAGMENILDPFQDFDARMAQNKADAEKAAVTGAAGAAGNTIGQSITAAVRASSADLKAIVVGTSDGEAFRNSIMRGADPRLDVKEDAKRTADNTERAADSLDDIASTFQGVALAGIAV